MEYKGLVLDKFQEEAIKSIEKNHSVVVSAPTGSGKTLIADYIINKDVKKGIRVIYTAPIKALSNQKYKEFSTDYGEEKVGLMTGDIVKNPEAPILIMTTEVYRNMVLSNDPMISQVSYVIFDEIHYINDIERGYVWEESIIFSQSHVRFLCLSATIPNAEEFAEWIMAIKEHEVDVITHDKRSVPLHRHFYDSELGICTLEDINEIIDIPDYKYITGRTGRRRPKVVAPNHVELIKELGDKLPCFFFNFSRFNCQQSAKELAQAKIFGENPKILAHIRKKLAGAASEINELQSTRILRKVLPYGVGFHHAGLIPVIKELVEELFSLGLIQVLYTTETFAVGINMPAKTVCFAGMRKFDGVNFRFLNSREYFQIAGRAGRRGIDKEGHVYSMIDRRDFEYKKLKGITTSNLDPIISQFRLSVNTVLNLIGQHDKTEIDVILRKNFGTYQKYGKDFAKARKDAVINVFNNTKKKLEKLDYIRENALTEKGNFSSRIYSDEILTGELFATEFYKDLNEYHLIMLFAAICFEPREKTEFKEVYHSKFVEELIRKIKKNGYLQCEQKFHYLRQLTALIDPCYHGKSIFEIIKNTNLLEGDLIRFFRQILDRIGQVRKATQDNQLVRLLDNCSKLVEGAMKDIDAI